MFNFIKLQKTYDRIFSTVLIILSVISIISFISISLFSKSIKFFAFDGTENGWIHLFNTFKFPLSTAALILPIYTLWITISRFYQYDESNKLNRQAFKLSAKAFDNNYRPFISNKYFRTIENDSTINFRIVNFGRIPAKINNISIEFFEQNKSVLKKNYNKSFSIIFPDSDARQDQIKYYEDFDFPTEQSKWIENKSDIKAKVIIDYQGLENTNYLTEEIWILDHLKKDYYLSESKWS